jgi:hypothetical protein
MAPERLTFGHSPHLLVVRAEGKPEHIRDDLIPEPLLLQLADEVEKDLIGRMSERRPDAGRCRQLRDEHRRLSNDRVNE